jgi:hypothetical protein
LERLTEAQRRALDQLSRPPRYNGVDSRHSVYDVNARTLASLVRLGYARIDTTRDRPVSCELTDAGRAALAAAEGG